jgi:hypothetical protein
LGQSGEKLQLTSNLNLLLARNTDTVHQLALLFTLYGI